MLLKDNLGQPGSYNSCSGECVVLVYYVTGIVDNLLSFIGPVIVIYGGCYSGSFHEVSY